MNETKDGKNAATATAVTIDPIAVSTIPHINIVLSGAGGATVVVVVLEGVCEGVELVEFEAGQTGHDEFVQFNERHVFTGHCAVALRDEFEQFKEKQVSTTKVGQVVAFEQFRDEQVSTGHVWHVGQVDEFEQFNDKQVSTGHVGQVWQVGH